MTYAALIRRGLLALALAILCTLTHPVHGRLPISTPVGCLFHHASAPAGADARGLCNLTVYTPGTWALLCDVPSADFIACSGDSSNNALFGSCINPAAVTCEGTLLPAYFTCKDTSKTPVLGCAPAVPGKDAAANANAVQANAVQAAVAIDSCVLFAIKCGPAAFKAYETKDVTPLVQCVEGDTRSFCDCAGELVAYINVHVLTFIETALCGVPPLRTTPAVTRAGDKQHVGGRTASPRLASFTSNDAGADDMEKLNKLYFNAMQSALAAHGESLQLYQPFRTILDAVQLVGEQDRLPPKSLFSGPPGAPTTTFVSGQSVLACPAALPDIPDATDPQFVQNVTFPTDGYAAEYKALVTKIVVPGGNLSMILGDGYQGWLQYRADHVNDTTPMETKIKNYVATSYNGSDPIGAEIRVEQYLTSTSSIASARSYMITDPIPVPAEVLYGWNMQNLTALQNISSQRYTIQFQSNTSSTDVSHTWADGVVGGALGFFSFYGGGDYDQTSTKIASSNISFNMTIGNYATIPRYPGPWFYGPVIAETYGRVINFQQDPQSSTTDLWNFYYNANSGKMAYYANEILIGTDISYNMTIENTFSDTEVSIIKGRAAFGFWPFFYVSATPGHNTTTVTSTGDSLTINFVSTSEWMVLGCKIGVPGVSSA